MDTTRCVMPSGRMSSRGAAAAPSPGRSSRTAMRRRTRAIIASATHHAFEIVLWRVHGWLLREPHWPKMFIMVMAASLWALSMLGICVWIWSAAFMTLAVFPTWELAVYFTLETFTTLGFGDVLAPPRWRILAGMAAANGLLNFGLMTAVLMEGVRDLRIRQSRSRSSRPGHRAGHEEV